MAVLLRIRLFSAHPAHRPDHAGQMASPDRSGGNGEAPPGDPFDGQVTGKLTPNHLKHVNVDTTVQEKAIAFPTDARLYHKARAALVKVATKCGITLRQSYERLGKRALLMNSRYLHARQMKRAKRELKKLRVFLGRVIRDIQRKLTPSSENKLSRLLAVAQRIHQQQKYDKNKVYSVHAPEVECIAKGKAHKRYEFGSKVAMVTSSKDNWILAFNRSRVIPMMGTLWSHP